MRAPKLCTGNRLPEVPILFLTTFTFLTLRRAWCIQSLLGERRVLKNPTRKPSWTRGHSAPSPSVAHYDVHVKVNFTQIWLDITKQCSQHNLFFLCRLGDSVCEFPFSQAGISSWQQSDTGHVAVLQKFWQTLSCKLAFMLVSNGRAFDPCFLSSTSPYPCYSARLSKRVEPLMLNQSKS